MNINSVYYSCVQYNYVTASCMLYYHLQTMSLLTIET